MRINPIIHNTKQQSFNAHVHMDLRVAEVYKTDETFRYLVDTLKSSKIKFPEI